MSETYCNNCGHRNPVGANFCSSCGAVLESSDDPTTITFFPTEPGDPAAGPRGETIAPVVLGAGACALVVRRGPNAGSRFALEDGVTTIGRHPDSAIFLDDVTVSRRHAEVRADAERHILRDVGSLNGTYVNRSRVDEATLESGDEVQIGTFKLVYLSAESDSQSGMSAS
jgi:pSer/pThr/pTyr-binding forkhead associated (FHA) protein